VGFRFAVGVEPLTVDVGRMAGVFRAGVENLCGVWESVFDAADIDRLREAARPAAGPLSLPDDLWVRLVYGLAVGYHHRVLDRQHLIRSSLPLYMGRVASFVTEVADLDATQVEERLERLCMHFEATKPYLLERWRTRGPRPGAAH
jgi:hypothetical protein